MDQKFHISFTNNVHLSAILITVFCCFVVLVLIIMVYYGIYFTFAARGKVSLVPENLVWNDAIHS